MTTAVIVRDDANLRIGFTDEFKQSIEQALAASALIGRVSNAEENGAAVQAQKLLHDVLTTAERARKEAKAPVIAYGRAIDDGVAAVTQEVREDMTRLSSLVGSFQQAEMKKRQAAERAAQEEASRLERERAAALAKANSEEAVDAVNEHFNNKAKEIAPPPEAPRAQGQRLSNDWEITVNDVWLLARHHSTCVKIEPLVGEIKNLLKAGVKVAGVTATPIVKAGVHGPAQRVLEV